MKSGLNFLLLILISSSSIALADSYYPSFTGPNKAPEPPTNTQVPTTTDDSSLNNSNTVSTQQEQPTLSDPGNNDGSNIGDPQVQTLIKSYNDFFHTSLNSQQSVIQDSVTRFKTYYQGLRSCTPGSYQYANAFPAGFSFNSSVISSMSNGNCSVETSYKSSLPNAVEKCEFTQSDLQAFTERAAVLAGKGIGSISTNDSSPIQKLIVSKCKTYSNGSLFANTGTLNH